MWINGDCAASKRFGTFSGAHKLLQTWLGLARLSEPRSVASFLGMPLVSFLAVTPGCPPRGASLAPAVKRQLAVEDEGDEDAAAASSIRNATEDMKRALGALQTQVRWLLGVSQPHVAVVGVLQMQVGCEGISVI